ncbi:zinc ribbon domain-containing protein [Anaeromyxobacter diazotrophicus]|uniref:DZANK-type domain-containing protein n=1 Tax=Anaeromyxobacter diazotrophicus TaxID=2590199 RepID=A0A7I9VKJ6_9BACT|nr:zinc ribbon domain-containing protein [Anaeromyxobacter diazotrophicus]GEJ56527.1 hypothetical protein AMYX_12680 [Anaeromyxobacter diazotrophicus]
MLSTLRSKVRAIRRSLAQVGDGQPLHRAALVVLLLLDAFILVSVLDGLDAHTRQLASPWDRVPSACRDLVLERSWTPATRLDRLADGAHRDAASDLRPAERRKALHPLCAAVLEPLEAIQRDPELRRLLELHRQLRGESRDLELALAGPKAAYDTALLAKVAKEEGGPDVAALRLELRRKTAALEGARARLATADTALDGSPRVAALWSRLDGVGPAERDRLSSDLRRLVAWFPVRRLAMQLAFLLPLFAAFYAWNAVSLRRRRGVQTLVSAHLLAVVSIPILIELFEAAYEVIPKRLLQAIFELLEAWNLVAIWHYLVIALAVAVALLAVHVVQRKVFSRERLLERRIAKGQCQACGKALPPGARACVCCGAAQFTACAGCGGLAHVEARYCRECGRERPAAAPAGDPGLA